MRAAWHGGLAVLCRAGAWGVMALVLACSSTPDKPQAQEIKPGSSVAAARVLWTAQVGESSAPFSVKVQGQQVMLVSSIGDVLALDAAKGGTAWRIALGENMAAGVGSDGAVTAVVSSNNELLALGQGRVLWRQRLPAQVYTAPLVAGERVFVAAADRSVSAFDGASGRRLWTQTRAGEPLVLRQPGVLLAVGDTLVVGSSGRLLGLNPLNGNQRWDVALATPRGTNDVERMVDLVGPAGRQAGLVCARAFQATVACVNTSRGSLLWSRPASGAQGVQVDESRVYGTESDGKVIAWRQSDGEKAWVSERLLHRNLTAPLVVGDALVVADGQAQVHWLSRSDGSLRATASTDGSGILSAPVQIDGSVVVVTRKGAVYALRSP